VPRNSKPKTPHRLETHVDGDDFYEPFLASPSLPPPARRRIHHPMDPAREPLAGGGGLQRRAAAAARSGGGPQEPPPRGQRPIHPDVDPPRRPWPWMQKLAIVAIVALGCLQFLPATHLRDPNDPRRNWIRIDGSRNPTVRYCAPRFVSLSVRALCFLELGIAEAMCSVD